MYDTQNLEVDHCEKRNMEKTISIIFDKINLRLEILARTFLDDDIRTCYARAVRVIFRQLCYAWYDFQKKKGALPHWILESFWW